MNPQGERLLAAIRERPLVMDAAMGTRLIAAGLNLSDPSDCSALWSVTHPDAVRAIHERDVAAGAEVIVTNTFLAGRTWLTPRRYGKRVVAINRWAASMAREAAGPDRFVLGSIGPTGANDRSGDDFREQAEALAAAGVDALLFETHLCRDATSALKAVSRIDSVPKFLSLCEGPSKDTANHMRRFEDLGVSVIGYNCMNGVLLAREWLVPILEMTRLPLLIRPATHTPSSGPIPEVERPEAFAAAVPWFLDSGVRLLGGCCGTTEAHVAAIRASCYAHQADLKARDD